MQIELTLAVTEQDHGAGATVEGRARQSRNRIVRQEICLTHAALACGRCGGTGGKGHVPHDFSETCTNEAGTLGVAVPRRAPYVET
jgi:hypothetical protein